jgi:hypothetical protein
MKGLRSNSFTKGPFRKILAKYSLTIHQRMFACLLPYYLIEDWDDVDPTQQTAKIPWLHAWVIHRLISEEDLTLKGGSFGSPFDSSSAGPFGDSVSMTGKRDSTSPRAEAAETHYEMPHEAPHANIIAVFMVDGKNPYSVRRNNP